MKITKSLGTLIFAFLFFTISASQVFAADWASFKTTSSSSPIIAIDSYGDYMMAVGYGGAIWFSANGGESWSASSSSISENLLDVDIINATVAFAVGENGVAYKTSDFGSTWTAMTTGTTKDLNDIQMYNGLIGWIAGNDGTILYTTNSGSTWTAQTVATTSSLYGLDVLSSKIAWVVGENGVFFGTANAGTTWAADSTGTTDLLLDVDFYSTIKAFAVGVGSTVIQTTDSGATWTDRTGEIDGNTFTEVYFTDSSTGYIAGAYGFAKTTDAGANWVSMGDMSSYLIYDIVEDGSGNIWAALSEPGEGLAGVYIFDENGPSAVPVLQADENPTANSTATIYWTPATDAETSVVSYQVKVDTGSYTDVGSTETYDVTLSEGEHTIYVRAVDEAGNTGDANSITVTVDQSGPDVSLITLIATTVGETVNLTVSATDDVVAVSSCSAYVNGVSVGSMTANGDDTFTKSYSFSATGTYSVYAICSDALGNSTTGTTSSVTVGSSSSTDSTAPSVGSVSPTNVTMDVTATFSASVADDTGISACYFYKDGVNSGSMSVSSGTASINFTFYKTGSFSLQVQCTDAAGNVGAGSATTVSVASGSTSTAPSTSPSSSGSVISDLSDLPYDTLIKTQCESGNDVNDPCRVVYYYSSDGKRHAFPNEKVYFTWYDDFDDVVLVSKTLMSSITLGHNATYHPGTKMVKFQTVNTVYAVEKGGVLRAIASEEVAEDLYGSTWNKQIDDISDAFFSNYSFGADIDSASDYDVEDAKDSVDSLADNF